MCGIFGCIGNNVSTDKFRLLALLNKSRGSHATGFCNGRRLLKEADSADKVIGKKDFRSITGRKTDLLFGHTRHSTHGSRYKDDNGHPFHKINIIGAHNGIVYNMTELAKLTKKDFEVDSEYLFYLFNLVKNYEDKDEVKSVLDLVKGYYGLVWQDLRFKHTAFLMRHDNTLSFTYYNKTMYFSSDAKHLKTVFGDEASIVDLVEDSLYIIDTVKLTVKIVPIKGLKKYEKKSWKTYADNNKTTKNHNQYYYPRNSGVFWGEEERDDLYHYRGFGMDYNTPIVDLGEEEVPRCTICEEEVTDKDIRDYYDTLNDQFFCADCFEKFIETGILDHIINTNQQEEPEFAEPLEDTENKETENVLCN